MNTIKLKNPIKINGKEKKELPFDTSTFGMNELERANKLNTKAAGGVPVVQEVDYNYHLLIAMVIIETTTGGDISIDDLKSELKGHDLFKVQEAGRNFLLGLDTQNQEQSDEQPEITA